MVRAWFCAAALVACKDSQPSHAQIKAQLESAMADAKLGEERAVGDGTSMTTFRAQATTPLPDGWQLAVSTKGGFSVELPLPFNDFRVRSQAVDHVEVDVDTVGAKSPGLLSWAAFCTTRSDGTVGPRAMEVANKTEALGTPVTAWQRTIDLGARICMLIVEAQGTDPLPPQADIDRFLHSFKQR